MISFDVFDTLITRKTATPDGIWGLMKAEMKLNPLYALIDDYVIQHFCELRKMAEPLARLGKEETTLEEIYEGIALTGGLSREEQVLLCGLERQTELENVLPIKENIDKVKKIAAEGEKVVLISDMYLDFETVSAMLKKADPFLGTIPLYLSSEYGKAKWTEGLYWKVKEAEKTEIADWKHFGDNEEADVRIPKRIGITAEKIQRVELEPCEKFLLEKERWNPEIQLQIGAAVLARRSMQTRQQLIGGSFGGEILLPYVLWLLEQCRRNEIQRLYFVARDGYLLKKIADRIITERCLPITTEYIYGSRKAWRIPAYATENLEWNLIELVLWSHLEKTTTIKDLAKVFELPWTEFRMFVPQFYREHSDYEWNAGEMKTVVRQLQYNSEFQCFFQKFHKAKRDRVIEYLRQTVDASDSHYAFVEIGGGGLTQECLGILMKDIASEKIRTFYFKVDRAIKTVWGDFYVFMPSLLPSSRIIEMVCRAPHEQTVDYKIEDGIWKPVFEGKETAALLNHGFADFEDGVTEFVESYLRNTAGRSTYREVDMCQSMYLMEYAAGGTDERLLEYLADMPTSETGRNDLPKETYAPRLTEEQIRLIFKVNQKCQIEKYYKGSDLTLSILRCNEEEKALIRMCQEETAVTEKQITKIARQELENWEHLLDQLCGPVSVYGAGKFGVRLVHMISQRKELHLVKWWDNNAAVLQEQGHLVTEPERIDRDCGVIIIAIKNMSIAKEVRNKLINLGADKEQVILLDFFWLNYQEHGFWPYNQMD